MTSLAELSAWVDRVAALTRPQQVHWCDGSADEYRMLIDRQLGTGTLIELNQETHPACYLHRSDPGDVARVEHLTFVCPEDQGFFRELAKRTLHRKGMEDWYLWAEVLSQVGGFAVKQEQLLESAAGNLKSITVVDRIAEETIDESLFQLPKGYSPQDE